MEHKQWNEMPAYRREVTTHITCDMCGKVIEGTGDYEVDEVVIRRKTGSNYPDGGDGEEVSPDICGECFDGKVVPWLKSQGVNTVTKDWSW